MTSRTDNSNPDAHLQALDVHVVDVLAHLEALLRHSHSIQRALLKLRSEAPPPPLPALPAKLLKDLNSYARQMRSDCDMLSGIVEDLAGGIELLSNGSKS